MARDNRPIKKINNKPNNKIKAMNKEKVIQERIEILVTIGAMGLVIGAIIGILIPIGGVEKSKYKELEEKNKQIQAELRSSKEDVKELTDKIEESEVFTSLDKTKKEQVINYIGALGNETMETTGTQEADLNTADIFDKLYKGYAYSLGYVNFKEFNIIIDTFGYQYETVEETDTKKVTLKDEYTGDNVVLTFSNVKENEDLILSSIRYNKGNKYIEVNNNPDEANAEYTTYDGTNLKVNNLNEQEKFLFSE